MNRTQGFICLVLLLSRVIRSSQDPAQTEDLTEDGKTEEVAKKLNDAVSEASKALAQTRSAFPDQKLPRRVIALYDRFDDQVTEVRKKIAEAKAKKKQQ